MNLFLRFCFKLSTPFLDFPWRSHTNCKAASGKSLAVILDSMSSLRPRSKVQGFQQVSAHFLMPYILLLPRALPQQKVIKYLIQNGLCWYSPKARLGTHWIHCSLSAKQKLFEEELEKVICPATHQLHSMKRTQWWEPCCCPWEYTQECFLST